ncbi:hypothetical protein A7D27_00370 [Pseudomonas sp. 1D4]|nr:hypothetical protein A7D27_00370 [Pseudomonas sp. 1D4]
MPLYAECEGPGAFDRYGFDQSVGRQRFNSKAGRQTFNTLAVDGIDEKLARHTEAGEHATRLHGDRVARCVLDFERLVFRLTVVHEALDLMHLLVQRAAEGHVHFLEAPADAQHRHATLDCSTQQRQGDGIAFGVMEGAGRTGRTGIKMRFYVGRRTGEQESV